MQQRMTEAVCRDHLHLARQDDIETDLARNFDAACVLLTSFGTFPTIRLGPMQRLASRVCL